MILTASIENYIKTIFCLECRHERATTQRIAERLGVKMTSVSGMMKHLAAEGYVRHTPYRGATVTPLGRSVALATIRRHRLIELFLAEVLDLGRDEAHDQAEKLEHTVSDHVIERIFEHLGRPEFDPHGAPIPREDGSLPDRGGTALGDVPEGTSCDVIQVSHRDPQLLCHLRAAGIGIGTILGAREWAPGKDHLRVQIGRKTVELPREAADCIRVGVVSTRKTPAAPDGLRVTLEAKN